LQVQARPELEGTRGQGELVQGAGWHVGMLARGEADQVQGAGWHVGMLARGEAYEQRDTGARRFRETKYRSKNSGWGGVGPSGI